MTMMWSILLNLVGFDFHVRCPRFYWLFVPSISVHIQYVELNDWIVEHDILQINLEGKRHGAKQLVIVTGMHNDTPFIEKGDFTWSSAMMKIYEFGGRYKLIELTTPLLGLKFVQATFLPNFVKNRLKNWMFLDLHFLEGLSMADFWLAKKYCQHSRFLF